MEQVRTKSVEPQHRFSLSEVSSDDVNEPGAYVERGTGDLYRVPKEALIPRRISHHPQREHRRIAPGAGQQEPVCNNIGGAAPLCAAQHRAKLLISMPVRASRHVSPVNLPCDDSGL